MDHQFTYWLLNHKLTISIDSVEPPSWNVISVEDINGVHLDESEIQEWVDYFFGIASINAAVITEIRRAGL